MVSRCEVLLVAGLAACASKQSAAVENVAMQPEVLSASGPQPAPSTTDARSGQGVPTSAPLHACTSAAPFTVRAANKTTTPTDVCAAFERAFAKAIQTVTFSPGGGFQVDVTLADVQLRRGPNTRFIMCKMAIALDANGRTLAQANGGATVDALLLATGDCTEAVIENLLPWIAQQMQQHVATTTAAGGVTPQSASGSATSPQPSP